MIKYNISYNDFNGNQKQEDLYFHLAKSNLLMSDDDAYDIIVKEAKELQVKAAELDEVAKKIGSENGEAANTYISDNPFSPESEKLTGGIRAMAKLVGKIVDLAYGVRSEDGSRFMQSPEILNDWKSSASYEAFLDKVLGDLDELNNFIKQVTSA